MQSFQLSRHFAPLVFGILMLFGSTPAAAQDEEITNYGIEDDDGFSAMSMESGAREWHQWYFNKTLRCFGTVTGSGMVSVRVQLMANGQQVGIAMGSGWKTVTRYVPFDPLNSSPSEMSCIVTATNQVKVDMRSSKYYGSYKHWVSDPQAILYQPYLCEHLAMEPAPPGTLMVNPAPGYPPQWPPDKMEDDGYYFKVISGPTSVFPYPMRFHRPKNEGAICHAPQ